MSTAKAGFNPALEISMSHEIDTTTGRAAMFSGSGITPWHSLGIVIAGTATSAEAINLAGLDWLVNQVPVGAQVNGQWQVVPDTRANVRSDTGAALAIVSDGYKVFQNADAFSFMDAVIGEGGAQFDSAGSLKGGRRVWMLAKMPHQFNLGKTGRDKVESYILLTNTHDKTGSLRLLLTTVRVVCQNTLNAALGRASSGEGIAIHHRESMMDKVAEARRALKLVDESANRMREELAALAAAQIDTATAKAYFASLIGKRDEKEIIAPVSEAAAASTFADLMAQPVKLPVASTEFKLDDSGRDFVDRCLANYINDKNTMDGIGGTAWAAFNAVSEYADHGRRTRGKDDRARAENRLASNWFGPSNDLKQSAYAGALALARN